MEIRRLYRNRINTKTEPISRYTLEGLSQLHVQLTPRQYRQIELLRKLGISEHAIIRLYERLLASKKKRRSRRKKKHIKCEQIKSELIKANRVSSENGDT